MERGDFKRHCVFAAIEPVIIEQLFDAVKHDRTSLANELMTVPYINVNLKDSSGWTPLMYAAKYNHIEILKILLAQSNIDVNIFSMRHGTALSIAVYYESVECIESLLGHADIIVNTTQPRDKDPPFIAAIERGNVEIVKLFLGHPNLCINYRGIQDRTPLMTSVCKASTELTKLILTQPDVDINARTIFDNSAVYFAGTFCRLEQILLLLKYGAKPSLLCQSQSLAIQGALTNWRSYLPSWGHRGKMGKRYPRQFRKCMFTLLLCFLEMGAPKDIAHLILEYAADVWRLNSKLPRFENYI